MAIEKTVKVKVDTGSSIEDLQGVEDGFQGIEEQAEDGTAATGGLILAVKGLGLALKTAGIGLAISLLVGLSNAFLTNQRIADLFNTGLEAMNLTFKALVNPYIEVIEMSYKMSQANEHVMANIENLRKILSHTFTRSIKGVTLAWKAATLAYEMSPFGSGDTETITQLKSEIRDLGDDLNNINREIAKETIDFTKRVGKGFIEGQFFKNWLEGATMGAKTFAEAWKGGPIGILKTANALVQLRNEVKLAEAEQRILQLTYQKDAEIQRQIRDDVSLTMDERIAANDELGRILDEQAEAERAVVLKKLELAQIELETDKTNVDLKVALLNATADLADLNERITGQRSEQLVNENSLIKEQMDLEKSLADQKKKAAEEEAARDKKLAESKWNTIRTTLGQISNLVGKESKRGKQLAKALAIIDMFAAANKALKQGGIWGAIAAAGIVAQGIANVKAIANTPLPGESGGGGGSIPTPMGIGGNLVPNPNLTPNLDVISPPDFGDPSPVQAYVVENDISDAQALQEELEIQATL